MRTRHSYRHITPPVSRSDILLDIKTQFSHCVRVSGSVVFVSYLQSRLQWLLDTKYILSLEQIVIYFSFSLASILSKVGIGTVGVGIGTVGIGPIGSIGVGGVDKGGVSLGLPLAVEGESLDDSTGAGAEAHVVAALLLLGGDLEHGPEIAGNHGGLVARGSGSQLGSCGGEATGGCQQQESAHFLWL